MTAEIERTISLISETFKDTPRTSTTVVSSGTGIIVESDSFCAQINHWVHPETNSSEWTVCDYAADSEPATNHAFWQAVEELDAIANTFIDEVTTVIRRYEP